MRLLSPSPAFGLILALFGALILTPDALLMRISGMDGFQMLGWRSTLMGLVMGGMWLVLRRRNLRADVTALGSGAGLIVAASQAANGAFFSLGIASAPVMIVLLAVATVPVFAAILSWLLIGERTTKATWITICLVLSGIALAVFGKPDTSAPFDRTSLTGAMFGLGVAFCLALSFTMLRKYRDVPILPAISLGALLAGSFGIVVTGVQGMTEGGGVLVIASTGLVILPLSFFCLSLASRHVPSATVSLLMLLETVLGPLWVWIGIGEAPSALMLAGGAIVLGSLSVYLLTQRA